MRWTKFLYIACMVLLLQSMDAQTFELDTMPYWQIPRYEAASPDSAFLATFKTDPDYDYRVPTPDDRMTFKEWVWSKFKQLFRNTGNSTISLLQRILFFGLILLALIAIILHLTRSRIDPLIESADQKLLARQLLDADIDPQDLSKQLEKFKAEEKWNLAIRSLYLMALRDLEQKDLIKLSATKTNKSYIEEIQEEGLAETFKRLVWIFEYDWYGGFEVGQEDLKAMESGYESLMRDMTNMQKVEVHE